EACRLANVLASSAPLGTVLASIARGEPHETLVFDPPGTPVHSTSPPRHAARRRLQKAPQADTLSGPTLSGAERARAAGRFDARDDRRQRHGDRPRCRLRADRGQARGYVTWHQGQGHVALVYGAFRQGEARGEDRPGLRGDEGNRQDVPAQTQGG